MHLSLSSSAAVLLTICLGSMSQAQSCLGAPSYSIAPLQIAADGSFSQGNTGVGASLGFGARKGPFIDAEVSRVSYDTLKGTGSSIGGSLGYEVAVSPATVGGTSRSNWASLCPLAIISYSRSPMLNNGFGNYRLDERDIGGGVAIGMTVTASTRISLIHMGRSTIS